MIGHAASVTISERISELHSSVSLIADMQKVTLRGTALSNIIIRTNIYSFSGQEDAVQTAYRKLKYLLIG